MNLPSTLLPPGMEYVSRILSLAQKDLILLTCNLRLDTQRMHDPIAPCPWILRVRRPRLSARVAVFAVMQCQRR
jgi:hypothetical protein